MLKDEFGKKQKPIKKKHVNWSQSIYLATQVMHAIRFNNFFIP